MIEKDHLVAVHLGAAAWSDNQPHALLVNAEIAAIAKKVLSNKCVIGGFESPEHTLIKVPLAELVERHSNALELQSLRSVAAVMTTSRCESIMASNIKLTGVCQHHHTPCQG